MSTFSRNLFISLLIGCTLSSGGTALEEASPRCRVKLSWKTETESNTFGYFIYRGSEPDKLECVNEDEPLHASGTTTTPARYRYYDLDVELGAIYYYRVQTVDLDGTKSWLVGAEAPIKVTAKALSETEEAEIAAKGSSFREEAADAS